MPRQGESLRARGIRRPQLAELRRAFAENERNRRKSFHIVDDGRLPEEPFLCRERRFRHRHSALPFDGGHQSGFLAADKGAGSFHDGHVKTQTRSENIVSEDSVRLRVRHRLAHAFHGKGVFGPDIDIAFIRLDCACSNHHAFDHRVGIAFHDGTVHERAGVAFIPVADDVFLVIFGGECQAPFPARGEAAASASAQSRILHKFADFFRSHLQISLLRSLIAAAGDVFPDRIGFNRAVRKNNAVLALIERNLVLGGIAGTVAGIGVDKAFDHTPPENRLADDFGNIGNFDLGIHDSVRLDPEKRSHLAEPLAAAFGNVVRAVLHKGFVLVLNIDIHRKTGFFQFGSEGVAHQKRTVGHTAGPAADDDAALDF